MTPIEINPIPVQIGTVWFYEKRNCHTWERYISVKEYKKRFGGIDKKYFTKPVVVYDEKKKEYIPCNSITEAANFTSVSRETIWYILNLSFKKLIRKRYSLTLTEPPKINIEYEYSNQNFN